MAIDTSKVKAKLNELQSKKKKNADGTYEKTDYKKIFWKPKLGKQVIRLVPFKTNPSEPVLEVSYHNGFQKFRIVALTNFGDKDPIVEFSSKLKLSDDKEAKDLGWKLSPKRRYFAQVVVRGEEANGTRLWEFPVNTYKDLLAIIADDDYGDILDVNDGRDITLEGVEDVFNGNKYIKITSILPKPKQSPLAESEAQINSFIDNQYDPLTINKKYSYDELLTLLEKFLNPEDNDPEVSNDATPVAEKEDDIDALPFVETNDDTSSSEEDDSNPPFDPDPVDEDASPVKGAIAAASKRIIAKNNAEMKASEEKVKGKPGRKPAVKPEAPKVTVKAETAVVKGGTATGSNKDKFAALFNK